MTWTEQCVDFVLRIAHTNTSDELAADELRTDATLILDHLITEARLIAKQEPES